MEKLKPDYKRIYSDIINKKYPEKMQDCANLLNKKELTVLDVLELNKKIFGNTLKNHQDANQKFKSYKESDILEILDYQKKNNLSNVQVANYFKISRNTISKWRRIFARDNLATFKS